MLRLPGWRTLLIAIAVVALRLPLCTRPGLGRDEATYLDWSRHLELAYAPLLQWMLRGSTSLGLPAWWGVRLPSILGGILVLWLFDRFLRARGAGDHVRGFAVAALAVSPWQSYAGSILHPDDVMLAAVLGFAWACRSGRLLGMLSGGALAVLAKPSGLLVSVVAVAVLASGRTELGLHGRSVSGSVVLRGVALLALLSVVALPLAHTTPAMVEAWREFGRMHESIGGGGRFGLGMIGLIVLGGPALVLALAAGAIESLRKADASASTILGLLFLAAFGAAALLYGQIKANWILPAALLLWPPDWLSGFPRLRNALVAMTFLFAAAITAGFVWPERVRHLETRVGNAAPSYASMAGTREAAVSSTRQWWHRVAEYQDLESFCGEVRSRQEAASPDAPVDWLVSDDYGLAAQWAATCPTRPPRLVFPLDPVFSDSSPSIPAEGDDRGVMILAVRVDPATLLPDRDLESLGWVTHPVTGDSIQLARPARTRE